MDLGPARLSSYAESADDSVRAADEHAKLVSSAGVTKVTGPRRPAKVITKKPDRCAPTATPMPEFCRRDHIASAQVPLGCDHGRAYDDLETSGICRREDPSASA
jgi:hypothetical protein